jgi:D-alanyl-D-alanine carboxypeptidase
MQRRPTHLINTHRIEVWPSHLLRARSNRDARILARGEWLLRDKQDGHYLAVIRGGQLTPLVTTLHEMPTIESAMATFSEVVANPFVEARRHLPPDLHLEYCQSLGIPVDYAHSHQLSVEPEPSLLTLAGLDRYRRPLWLQSGAANAWHQLVRAAASQGVSLEAVSGYRSSAYQCGIFERKLARGQSLADILAVNAAPGYSEHHSGRAIDISSAGEPSAEASFEGTPAFAWLQKHADSFGFAMSYPRGNPHGVIYEPWHWCWKAAQRRH